jgi:hypothetical protein
MPFLQFCFFYFYLAPEILHADVRHPSPMPTSLPSLLLPNPRQSTIYQVQFRQIFQQFIRVTNQLLLLQIRHQMSTSRPTFDQVGHLTGQHTYQQISLHHSHQILLINQPDNRQLVHQLNLLQIQQIQKHSRR